VEASRKSMPQYAQLLQSVLWSGHAFNQAITDRINCTVNRVLGNAPTPGVSWGKWLLRTEAMKVWSRVWGVWNNNDGDVNAPGYNEDQVRRLGWWDYAFDTAWFLGLAGGYFQSRSMNFDNFGGVNGGSAADPRAPPRRRRRALRQAGTVGRRHPTGPEGWLAFGAATPRHPRKLLSRREARRAGRQPRHARPGFGLLWRSSTRESAAC